MSTIVMPTEPTMPIARNTDPATSHEAATQITADGTRQQQTLLVLYAARMKPGSTSAELACAAFDRYVAARCLPELEQVQAVARGLARACKVTGNNAITWWPVDGAPEDPFVRATPADLAGEHVGTVVVSGPDTSATPGEAPMFMDLEEAKYNARDVLGMCRVFTLLCKEVERTGTEQVYLYDRRMAFLALQMSRVGMPVDLVEKDRVGKRLREIRDTSLIELRKYVMGQHRAEFLKWVAHYSAAKPRLKDPKTGDLNPATNLLHSAESALLARSEIRREAFLKHFVQWELVQVIREDPSNAGAAFDALYDMRAASLKSIARKMTSTWDDPAVQDVWLTKSAEKGVNFGAKIQQAAIMRAAGVPLLRVTEKTALPKISKETLEEFGHHAAARAMLNFILTSAALRTFIDNLPVDPVTQRLHPDWMTTKITGRWGSSPNVQNWSKRAGGGVENLRRMIAAPEGYIFVGADQKQLEARLIAAASQDPFLIDVFKRNADIHGELAGVAFPAQWPVAAAMYAKHKPLHKKTKVEGIGCGLSRENPYCELCAQRDTMRDLTKRLEYGAFYGGSADTLWKSVVKDFPEIKPSAITQFLHTVGQRMAGVISWRNNVLREAMKSGEIRSPILGRREVFPLAQSLGRVEPTVAYNFIPQSGGADLWAVGAAKFMDLWPQTGDDARICHNGHDSVLILTKEDLADQVEADVHTCWEMEWGGVPFLMDCKRGRRWSEV